MNASTTIRVALDNITPDYYRPVRSVLTGGDVFRERPAACSDPMVGIFGYAEAQERIAETKRHLTNLREDLQACKLKAIGVEEAKVALTKAASRGEKIPVRLYVSTWSGRIMRRRPASSRRHS